MDKDRQYAILLWVLVAVIIILQIGIEVLFNLPESLEFVTILMWFFCLLAAVFAVYYSYNVIELKMKRRKKRKRSLKSLEEKKES